MSVGSFERGPVRGVMERFSSANPPQSCLPELGRPSMMGNWWIDDQEIADYLASLAMPVHYADITIEQEGLGDQGTTIWRWLQPGMDESWMTFARNGQVPGSMPLRERIFWFNESMVAFMDLNMESEYDLSTTAVGQLAPPSVYAFSGQTQAYAGATGLTYSVLGLSASLEFFGDFECEQPLS